MGISLSMAYAQSNLNLPNVDFENNSFENWNQLIGKCCPILTETPLDSVVANRSRFTVISGSGVDPYGKFPMLSPSGSKYSVRLGNQNSNAESERLQYFVTVPEGLDNYKITVWYALVLQEPGHMPLDQPRFEMKVYDIDTKETYECATFDLVASKLLTGFIRGKSADSVIYKPWSAITIDFSNYVGRTMVLDFATGDCARGGHFAYAYLDIVNDDYSILGAFCPNSTTANLNAPSGYKTYQWFNQSNILVGNKQLLTINNPISGSTYKVIVKQPNPLSCPDTFYAKLIVSDLKLGMGLTSKVCIGDSVQFYNTDSVSDIFRPLTYQWLTYTEDLSCSNCLNPKTKQKFPVTKYVLKVKDNYGCEVVDSVVVTVALTTIKEQPYPFLGCLDKPSVLHISITSNVPYKVQWYRNKKILTADTSELLYRSITTYSDTGQYYLRIITKCDTIYSDTVSLNVYPSPITHNPENILACKGNNTNLYLGTTNQNRNIQWYKNLLLLNGFNKPTINFDSLCEKDTGSYYAVVTTACDTFYSDTAFVRLKPGAIILKHPQSFLGCPNDSTELFVEATGNGSLKYVWEFNGQIIDSNSASLRFHKLDSTNVGYYSVAVFDTCNSAVSDTAIIFLQPLPNKIFPDTTKLCPSDLRFVVPGFYNYLWSTGEKTNFKQIQNEGSCWLKYTASNNCSNVDTTYFVIRPLASIEASKDTIMCNESTMHLHASALNYDSIAWEPNPYGVIDSLNSLMVNFTTLHSFSGSVAQKVRAFNVCGISVDSITIQIVPKETAKLFYDSIICVGSPPLIIVPLNMGGQFTGKFMVENKFFPDSVGQYQVQYFIEKYGCVDSSEINIRVAEKPIANFTYNPSAPEMEQEVEFHSISTNANTLLWIFNDGIQKFGSDVKYVYPNNGHFTVKLVAELNACADTAIQDIAVKAINGRLWVPNAFTPDGDGLNDIFKPTLYHIKIGEMIITDRWGKRVFETSDLTKGWDGTINNIICPIDVYVYQVKYMDYLNNWKEVSGTVSLLR